MSDSKSPKSTAMSVEKLAAKAEKLRQEEEKARLVKEAHRKVVDSIYFLVDTVEESELLEKLHFLDTGSWDEVIEERYLARSCGFPTCSRQVVIYTALPLWEKFCSTECYDRSCNVQRQLHEEPLWFSLERKARNYSLESTVTNPRSSRNPEEIFIDQADRFLVTRLNEMKIADSFAEQSDEENDEGKEAEKKEDENFRNEIRSFLTSVSQMTAKSNANMMGVSSGAQFVHLATKNADKKPNQTKQCGPVKQETKDDVAMKNASPPNNAAVTVQTNSKPAPRKFSDKEVEEKLSKLRQKYNNPRPKKIPVLIDAPAMSADKAAKLSDEMR
ncbi:RNA polymerase II subunit B1 CTD phosphatase RPAP2-like protein [Aphelenchoides besseyi]|nr:RNA polymerase II subunit B1 CTD phosphatase RPAP2-like protein [Aphelenchoides besseyi]